MSTNGPVLSIRGLERRFGSREIIRKLDLAVEPGERVALWGPNGSGKTTVLRCVAGTLAPSGGEIRVGEHPAGDLDARRLVGSSLSQERSFYLRLTGHANLLFFARVRFGDEAEAVQRVAALEDELELGEIAPQRVDRCSSGMIQQLGFARALLGEPAVLLLDEPTKSLDVAARGRLWAALDRRATTSVLMATHLDEDLEHCGERVNLPV